MHREIAILVVDDDRDCRTLTCEAIARGCPDGRAHEVAGAAEALEYLRRRGQFADATRPDLIYLDVDMQDMSGLELLKIIKSDPALASIPIIMLSGQSAEDTKRQAACNGAEGYAIKPGDPHVLAQIVRETVRRWLQRRAMPSDFKTGPPTSTKETRTR